MFTCGISGHTPAHPVVTRTGGVLFEKALIEAYIDLHHQCPITGGPLEREDLVPLRTPTPTTAFASSDEREKNGAAVRQLVQDEAVLATTTPTMTQSTLAAVPSLVDRLQMEWCGLQLEQFQLRQQLLQTQHALAHALHKNEAAVRVVGRLASQVNALEEQLTNSTKNASSAASSSSPSTGPIALPGPVSAMLDAHAHQQRESRRRHQQSRQANANAPAQVKVEECPMMMEGGEGDDRAGATAGVTAMTAMTTATATVVVAVGNTEGQIHLLTTSSSSSASTKMTMTLAGVGHTDAIHTLTSFTTPSSVTAAAPSSWLLSGSFDKSVKLWELVVDPTAAASSALNHAEKEEEEGGDEKKRRRTEETTAQEASTTTTTTTPSSSSSHMALLCRQTLYYPHGVTTLAANTVATVDSSADSHHQHHRFLFAAGGVHSPHVYLSDVERGEHIASVDLLRSGNGGGSALQRDFAPGACVTQAALHPYGSIGGLLLHQPSTSATTSSSSLGSLFWDSPSSAAFTGGTSVVALWDVKAMARDTLIPITPAMLLAAERRARNQHTAAPLTQQQAAAAGVAVSLDFAPDAVTMAVGLSTGAALVWDLRKVQEPLVYLPPSPTARVLTATSGAVRGPRAATMMMKAAACPAVVRFSPTQRQGAGVLAVVAGTEVSCYPLSKLASASGVSSASSSSHNDHPHGDKDKDKDDDVVALGGSRTVLHGAAPRRPGAFYARDVTWMPTGTRFGGGSFSAETAAERTTLGLVVGSCYGGVASCDVVV